MALRFHLQDIWCCTQLFPVPLRGWDPCLCQSISPEPLRFWPLQVLQLLQWGVGDMGCGVPAPSYLEPLFLVIKAPQNRRGLSEHPEVGEDVQRVASLECRLLFPSQGEKSVSVDGKCSDPTLLSNLLEEMKETLATC